MTTILRNIFIHDAAMKLIMMGFHTSLRYDDSTTVIAFLFIVSCSLNFIEMEANG